MDPAYRSLIKIPRETLRNATDVRDSLFRAQQNRRESPEVELVHLEVEEENHHVVFLKEEAPPVPIRIYRRKDVVGLLPVLLYFHGGGFFCGDLSSDAAQCSYYALNAGCAVVCVEYRLAPEDPFPAALTDCYRVLEFLGSEGKDYGLNPGAIAVGGSSAGANLAAAVALLARDQMGPEICFQMLLVPALDDRLDTSSARQFVDLPDFARPEAEIMWQWYVGGERRPVSQYAAPARAKNLSDLPRAYVLCAGLDPLRDEGLEYAHRLMEAGVGVELHLMPSIPHGFASVPSASISRRLLKEQVDVLRGAFGFEARYA